MLPAAVVVAILSIAMSSSTSRADSQVRRFWGNEALWGYWEFGDDYLPKRDWKIVSVSHEAQEPWKAQNLIDDDANTFYYPNGKSSYEVVIDLGASYELGALTILTLGRPNNAIDSRMGRYELFVSDSKGEPGRLADARPFDGEEGKETVAEFPTVRGRYVTLKAVARPNATKEVCLRELSLITAEAVRRHRTAHATQVATRTAAWQQRNSDRAADALGRELLDMLFCTPDDINRSNLRNRPKLEQLGKLKAAGRYCEALKVFREYYFDKLRRPQAFGTRANDVHPYGTGYAGIGDFPGRRGQESRQRRPDEAPRRCRRTARRPPHAGRRREGLDRRARKRRLAGPARPTVTPRRPTPCIPTANCGGQRIAAADRSLHGHQRREISQAMDCLHGRLGDNDTFIGELHPVINHDNSLYPVMGTLRMLAWWPTLCPSEARLFHRRHSPEL